MIQVTNLSDAANQLSTVTLADGSTLSLNLIFRAATQRWTVSATRGDFTVNDVNMCLNPNLLRAFRETIPFGLTIISTDGADPFDINDWINGRCLLYVLDNTDGQTDVDQCELEVYGALV